jgi:hypothetical protein
MTAGAYGAESVAAQLRRTGVGLRDAHVGRARKTIHLLDDCSDQPFGRRILTQLSRDASRRALARNRLPRPSQQAAPPAIKAKKNNSACSA